MTLRAMVRLIMGLTIQFALMQPMWSANPVSHCAESSCCEGLPACPCASNDDPDQKPAPLAPAPVDLKLSAPKARELDLTALLILWETSQAVVATASIPESHGGFAGVPLSVAFCTFVI
jgi:hypothetical protein